MVKIGLLSDTHGHIDPKIFQYFDKVDEIWHAGDVGDVSVIDKLSEFKAVRGVYGNIDNVQARNEFPEHLKFTCEGVNVWMTHIGGYPPRYNQRIRNEIQMSPPDLFVCGHSHILKVMPDKKLNLLHMNPGAIGKHGFHKVRTMLRFNIADGKIQNLIVIEYPR